MAIKFVILQYALDVVKINWIKSLKVFWLCQGETQVHTAGPLFEVNFFTDRVFGRDQLPSADFYMLKFLEKSSVFQWPQP